MKVCMHEVSKNKDRTNEQNVAICMQAWRDRNKKSLTLPLQFRAVETERSIDPETRTLSFSFSSRQPVKKFWGTEVLSHAPGAVDTDRLKRGAVPFLLDHNREKLIGKVVGYELKDERMHATVRLSQSALASEVMQEMADGIRDNISVGYVPREAKLVSTSDKDGDTFLVTKWEVMVVSSVAIPADPTVGIGRDLGESETYECRGEPEPEGINP